MAADRAATDPPLSSPGIQLEHAGRIEAQTLATVRQLLDELGASRGIEELAARGPAAHLERELGFGSLERVELMLRLDRAFGIHIPDQVVAQADHVVDLIAAIEQEELRKASGAGGEGPLHRPMASASVASRPAIAERPDFERQVRSARTLTEILRLRGLGEPSRAHIHLYGEDHEPRTITFGELYSRAAGVAGELRRQGLAPAETVAIMLPTCAEFFHVFAGILLAGGIPVPIYPPFRADRIAEYAARQASILNNAECRFLVTFRQAEGLARLLQPRVPSLRGVLNAQRIAFSEPRDSAPSPGVWRPVENLSHEAHEDEIAFLQYTSGSTGDPKGVTLTHANLLANIRAIVDGVGLQPEDSAVSWLPLYHDMGLIGAWMVPLYSGNPVAIMSPLAFLSRPERWLWAIHRHRATMSPAPNFAYELCLRRIADADLQGLDLSCWRAALNGAEPVRADTMERFAARFASYGFRREALLPVYGLAEASLAVSVPRMGDGYRLDRIQRSVFESEGRAVPASADDSAPLEFVSAGQPLGNVEVRIVTSDGTSAGERVEGRLHFRSPSATCGYYRNPRATGNLLAGDGWLDSGDLAYQAEGELFITGRVKDVVIKGGRKLYPQEIEEIAGQVPGVRAGCVAVFGAPDARSGTERLVVAVEVRSRGEDRRISAEISRRVHDAMGIPPDLVELLPPQSIPKTSSGKLRRGETRRLFLAGKLGKRRMPPWVQAAGLAIRGAAPRAAALAKRGARKTWEVAYGVYALSAFAVILLPLWLMVVLTRDPKRAARRIRTGARWILLATGVPIRREGVEALSQAVDAGGCIFTPNHSSYLDILVSLAHLPASVRFVAKGEVLKMPFFGTIARRSRQFAFDRGDSQARIRQAQEVNEALGKGESVVIYPEGTFTAMTGIRPFQLGAFKSAVDAQRPICPVALRGARQILRDGTRLPRPGSITITFGPLLRPDPAAAGAWEEIVRLRDATRAIIAQNAGEPLL